MIVHYYSIADCRVINECIGWMRGLLLHLRKWKEADSYSHFDAYGISDTSCLHKLAMIFSPWLDPKSYANKIHFIAKDGLTLVSEVMSILSKIPLVDLPTKLQHIEMQMLCSLWNFTENAHTRKAVVQSDGIEICKRALLRVPVKPLYFHA